MNLLGVGIPALALAASGLQLWLDRRHGLGFSVATFAAAVLLAATIAGLVQLGDATPSLLAVLVVATLSRHRGDLLPSECALKLLWVLGVSLTLSWAGVALLAVGTSTTLNDEQWAVLRSGVDPDALWTTALPLAMLAGLVLVGGAPFHFWAADVVQGARVGFAALAVAGLQRAGVAWLDARLDGIANFPPAARIADSVMGAAAGAAFIVGALTLPAQRRPERRVGTLASLNGALALCALVVAHGTGRTVPAPRFSMDAWAAHLALALTGAGLLARFLPVRRREAPMAPVLFRRHPLWGCCGLYALASLAGVPGTPGAILWLNAARDLVEANRPGLVLAMGAAWVAAFATVVRDVRAAFGPTAGQPAPPATVPLLARAALAIAAAGLAVSLAWPHVGRYWH